MPATRKAVIVVLVLCATISFSGGFFAATQYCASSFRYHPSLGRPVVAVLGTPCYVPWAWLSWEDRSGQRAPRVFAGAQAITFGGGLLSLMLLLAGVARARRVPESTAHGSAHWATRADLQRAGMLDPVGVVLCQTADARFSSTGDGQGGRRWKLSRPGSLVRHGGPEHVLVFAPTRSGKGIGTVVPTLLSWPASVLVYDIKKELWDLTAGWRRTFSHCWRFEPTGDHGVRYNPLFEVRRGPGEVRDVQNIAEILIDPEGKAEKDHWRLTGAALLTGVILHVLYAERNKSLAGVAAFLSDPQRSQFETLHRMLTTSHLPEGPHPVVAQTARAMLNKSENELSGVVSTAMAALTLYEDPIVARNTARSDFQIADLMNADSPVSLYLVVPPSDLDRTRPLIRLLLNQMGKRLTEKMSVQGRAYAHRLLMLLDEFPTLGRLSFFESALAFSAGYGIKCFLICQSLNQLEKAYGRDNSIVDNCHVRMAYAANRSETAKTISELMGQSTASKRQRSVSGKSLLGPRSVSESDHEFARPLMTPDEVLRLPYEDALVFVGGLPPYRGRKLMYYLDRRLAPRAGLVAPDSRAEQRAELLKQRGRSEWEALPGALPPLLSDLGLPGAGDGPVAPPPFDPGRPVAPEEADGTTDKLTPAREEAPGRKESAQAAQSPKIEPAGDAPPGRPPKPLPL
jgi:type IV secretion system protein VirD4